MQNEVSVYIDIIFLENLIIDYVIVDICGRVSGFSVKPLRVLLSAVLGAVYAVFICIFTYFATNVLLSVLMKIILGLLMCVIAFGFVNRRRFILCNVLLYAVSFIFAGVFLALQMSGKPAAVNDRGLVVSWGESSALYVFGTVFIGYIVAVLLIGLIKKRRAKTEISEIAVEFAGKCSKVTALCDTGNELRDTIRNLPVIICEKTVICDLFDGEFFAFADKLPNNSDTDNVFELLKMLESSGFAERASIIPYKTVSNDNCMMLGIAVDRVYPVAASSCEGKRATVCFVDRKLSDFGEYNAVASPEIFI